VSRLLTDLNEVGLVRLEGREVLLTEKGQQSALRLLRSHRLWERYLADRTGVPSSEWHKQAERMEHSLTVEETNALASRLGHPRYDPHGGPIPTAAGTLPPKSGVALFAVDVGEAVEVIRLTDESAEVMDGLRARGVTLHASLEVVERSENTVTVRVAGEDATLGHLAAGAVVVRRLPREQAGAGSGTTLADLAPWETGTVTGISVACQGAQRRRLLDLGVVPGAEIVPEFASGAGDPVAYRISDALVALRRSQAEYVEVDRKDQGGEA
jgi:DtxR family Mn-dependent transcriptional regulator